MDRQRLGLGLGLGIELVAQQDDQSLIVLECASAVARVGPGTVEGSGTKR